MKAGVSTACLYPDLLENTLEILMKLGITDTEIFVNTHSETTADFTDMLARILADGGASCTAYHPFTCPIEPMMFFSGYERRITDMLEYYKYFFEAMTRLHSEIFVLHGNLHIIACPDDYYFEVFSRISETARSFGVVVAQENVARCQSRSLDFLRKMSQSLGDDARFVLDIKQAVRSGENPFTMADVLGNKIIHVHMSDHDEKSDCLLPGKGTFNIEAFLMSLMKKGFDGSVILELYRNNFDKPQELKESFDYLDKIIKNIRKERTTI
ncbi:MAG: sugar phosphate isomerase/epimerase [Ruminococcus sp.]|jgi:sugar phosphate isomerase/epimerase|nr:sugar phosphate isomerase/epimerase [Ruminococcus sp.]